MAPGTSLAVQWLRLYAPNAVGMGSIPGWETKILHAAHGQKKKGSNLFQGKLHPGGLHPHTLTMALILLLLTPLSSFCPLQSLPLHNFRPLSYTNVPKSQHL